MKWIKIAFWILWRIWFYILLAIPIIVMFPFLLLSVLSERGYTYFFIMARIWARSILWGMGFYYKIEKEQDFQKGKSYMLVANHTSMIDIMLMLVVAKNPFVFVGKKELAKIPLFGFFYKRSCILVDRSDAQSRKRVFDQAQKRIDQGLGICIFPEGGVPDNKSIILDNFKDGAFRLAIQHQIPIVPIVFPDNKKRFSYTFLSGSPGLMRVKMLSFVEISKETAQNRKYLKDMIRNIIYNELKKLNKNDSF